MNPMREILFRGKRTDNGEWIYGDLMQNVDCIKIREQEKDVKHIAKSFEIDLETVGQYTDLTDKNGKRIFEGDIVAQNWYDYDEPRDDSFGKVVFCEYDCSFSVMDVNKDGFMPLGRCGSYHWEVEVIGNIHDNPEMLKGGEV